MSMFHKQEMTFFRLSSCLYRASMTIKILYYPTDAQINNS